ncbi:MAG: DUF6542 domain-containing protein [Streptosporangiaceae bacterium]
MITESRKTGAPTVSKPKQPGITLTGRGGLAVLFGVTLLGSFFDVSIVPGLAFVAGCVLAAVATKPSDLPSLVVTPPVVFFLVTLIAEFVDALGSQSIVQSMAVSVPLALGLQALWIFVGTVAALAVALRRGLLRSWRDIGAKPTAPRLTQERYVEEDAVRWEE